MVNIFKLDLIDEQYTKVLDLFEILLVNEDRLVNKLSIEVRLGISEYILANLTSELSDLLVQCFTDKAFELVEDKDTIRLVSKYGISKHDVIEYLLKQSHKCRMFLLIGQNKFNINQYSNNHFISVSKVYKERCKLKKNLETYGISIDKKNELIGDEIQIRRLLMSITTVSQSIYAKNYQSELLKIIKSHSTKEVSYSFINYIFLYIDIIKYRKLKSCQKCISKCDVPAVDHCEELAEDIDGFLNKIIHMNKEAAIIEANIISTWIYCEYVVLIEPILWKAFPVPVVDEFITAFFKTGIKLSSKSLTRLREDLNRIVYKSIHPLAPDFSSYTGLNIVFFEEMFPEFYYFSKEVIRHSTQLFYEGKQDYLFYSYIMSLTEHVKPSDYVENIVICIDFHEDINYYSMIKKNVEAISNVRIVVTCEYNRKVDIVITDRSELYAMLESVTLVWRSPPIALEWKVLGNHIVRVRREKFNEWNKKS